MKIESNIRKNYLFVFLSGTSLSEAIWVLYLAYRGMSLVQIGLLESIFHITSMLMEVPTGLVADRFGRKTSRVLGRLMSLAGTLLMISARDFPLFALSFVCTALSYNLESGAGDALVYDSLLAAGKAEGYMKTKGRQEIAYQGSRIVSLAASGIVATFDYTLAYLITLGIHGLAFLLSLSFVEPPIPNAAGHAGGNGEAEAPRAKLSLPRHLAASFRALKENISIVAYILFVEGFGVFYTTTYFYFQTFLKSKGYVEWRIGAALALAALAGMAGGANTHRIERALGERRLVSLSPFAALAAFALIAFTGLEIPGIVALAAVEGILFVSFSAYINRLIPSAQRATLLSFQSMAFSVMMAGFFPLVGSASEAWGFKPAFALLFAAAVPTLLFVRMLLLRKIP
jgi:MFS family permease